MNFQIMEKILGLLLQKCIAILTSCIVSLQVCSPIVLNSVMQTVWFHLKCLDENLVAYNTEIRVQAVNSSFPLQC